MWEHRLIEQMIPLIREEITRIGTHKRADLVFIDMAVDFFRTYADRTHHGKEEDILFRDLRKKQLSPEHERIMHELMEEHIVARTVVGTLVESKEAYVGGDDRELETIIECFTKLADLYPTHIKKEDKHFFYPALDYLTDTEQLAILDEFREFDRNMIHEIYRTVVRDLGGKVP